MSFPSATSSCPGNLWRRRVESHKAAVPLWGNMVALSDEPSNYSRALPSPEACAEGTRRRLLAAVGRLIEEEYGVHVVEDYRSKFCVSRKL